MIWLETKLDESERAEFVAIMAAYERAVTDYVARQKDPFDRSAVRRGGEQ